MQKFNAFYLNVALYNIVKYQTSETIEIDDGFYFYLSSIVTIAENLKFLSFVVVIEFLGNVFRSNDCDDTHSDPNLLDNLCLFELLGHFMT